MANLNIPTKSIESVLLADDEPEHLEWLVDYLQAKGLAVRIAINVEEAMKASEEAWYRAYIVDLNIPWGNWPVSINPVFDSYPGFAIIQAVRSQGNNGLKVIAYSAHSNTLIEAEIKSLYTDYVAKGRPQQLKDRINDLLGMNPKRADAGKGK
jgi:CheY-like chemotaxis protein